MEVSMQIMNDSLLAKSHDKHKLLFSKNVKKPRMMISCQVAMRTDHDKNTTNFYQILSLNSQNVGFDEIKKAYKTMALQYHPDVVSGTKNNTTRLTKEESTKRFIEVRKAYETLSDPYSRKIYDSELGSGDSFTVSFPRDVWERQLNGLRQRCGERIKARRSSSSYDN